MFSVAIFLKVFALCSLIDVFGLALMGIFQHHWMLFRVVCGVVATLCVAAFAAIAFS